MIGDLWMNIRNEHKKGLSISEIAKKYNINWRTAKKYALIESRPKYIKKLKRKSKLDPYREIVNALLEEASYSAVRVYEKIQELGYTGKIGIVRSFVNSKKKELTNKATARFETLPGKQAQVDWAHCGSFMEENGKKIKIYCFLMILGYSRMRYVEFTINMSTETLIKCHINAFKYFNGYSEEILYDNMKQVVIKRLLNSKDRTLNSLFEDFSGFYSFKPLLCRPYRPQTKGKIERTVRYVKDNFLTGIKFKNLADLNNQAHIWCEKVNNKVHGTTGKVPYERLKEENLNKISKEYILTQKENRKVEKDCLLSFKGNKYSIPSEYIGKEVTVITKNNLLEIYYDDKLIASHNLSPGKNQMIIDKKHYLKLTNKHSYSQKDNILFIPTEINEPVAVANISNLDNIYGRVNRNDYV